MSETQTAMVQKHTLSFLRKVRIRNQGFDSILLLQHHIQIQSRYFLRQTNLPAPGEEVTLAR